MNKNLDSHFINIVQEVVIKTIPQETELQKSKMID